MAKKPYKTILRDKNFTLRFTKEELQSLNSLSEELNLTIAEVIRQKLFI